MKSFAGRADERVRKLHAARPSCPSLDLRFSFVHYHHQPLLTNLIMSKPQAGSKFRLSLALPVGAVMKWVSDVEEEASAARSWGWQGAKVTRWLDVDDEGGSLRP